MDMNGLDSLPYIDSIHEDYEQYAAGLIEEEMERSKPEPSFGLAPLPPVKFRSATLEQAYQKVASGEEATTTHNYKAVLKPPEGNSVEDWQAAVRQAKVELEKERIRGMMLELEKEGIAADQWKKFNQLLDSANLDSVLQLQRQRVDRINMKRQEYQEGNVGRDLDVLNTQYHQLVDKVYRLKCAIANLKGEIASHGQTTNVSG